MKNFEKNCFYIKFMKQMFEQLNIYIYNGYLTKIEG